MSLPLTDLTMEKLSGALDLGPRHYLALAAIGLVWILKSLIVASAKRRKMAPGPPGVPLLGNVFDVPSSMPWFKFTEWKQQYGTSSTFGAAASILSPSQGRSSLSTWRDSPSSFLIATRLQLIYLVGSLPLHTSRTWEVDLGAAGPVCGNRSQVEHLQRPSASRNGQRDPHRRYLYGLCCLH